MKSLLSKSGRGILLQSVQETFGFLFFLIFTPAAHAILDVNGNGLSDLWEKGFNNGNLFPATFDPHADDDQDGWSNILEAAAGTDPKNPNPPDGLVQPVTAYHPAVAGVTNSVPVVTVTWPTIAGKQYTILFSPDLTEGSWLPVEEPFIAHGGANTYYFREIELADKRFWRVSVQDIDVDGDELTDAEERQIGSSPYLADTDGDGLNDSEALASGLNPSGSGSDTDGDGVPDNELYAVVFEIQNEYHGRDDLIYAYGYNSNDPGDVIHHYFTSKDTERYSVSGSAYYPDVTNGSQVKTNTYLANGTIHIGAFPLYSEQGTSLDSWQGINRRALGEDETVQQFPTVVSVVGPITTGTQIKTITTKTTPWTLRIDGVPVSSGTEIITVTEQTDLCDETTYPQFWTNHVKSLPWQELQPYECGPNESMVFLRAIFGDAVAAEMIRNQYLHNGFSIFGTISDPGRTFADHGSDIRPKSLRWRWVRFNPQNPFYYVYATPPASLSRTFYLLVSQHNYLGPYLTSGGSELDETATKGIVEIVCNSNEGSSEWQTVPLTKFNPYKLEEPSVLENMDFSKVGWSDVRFDNLPAQIIPDRNSVVSADDHTISIVFQMGDGWNQSQQGSTIEWQIESGSGGSLSETETQIEDGLTAVTLSTSTVKGTKYVLKARIKSIGPDGENMSEASPWIKSSEIEVVAGKPYTFEFTTTKSSYRSDGTDISEITATIKDQYNNLVEDESSVSWSVAQCPTPPFTSKDEVTVAGVAKAVLKAPLIAEDQIVTCRAGDKQDSVTVAVSRVTGSIAGNLNLDLGAGQSSTLTITAQAADGTPVYWTTSNGDITAQSEIQAGSAVATLTSSGGRLGVVVVTASVGDRMLLANGEFTSTAALAMGAEHPVLIADESADGIHTPAYADGVTRQIPFYASTPVRVKGPANSVVQINLGTSGEVSAWAFNTVDAGVTPSADGIHPMGLIGGVVADETQAVSGKASLLFDGTGSGSIPDGSAFHFEDQMEATFWMRPTLRAAATLVSKTGSWQIVQLADGRTEASVTTDTGTYVVTSITAPPLDQWTQVAVDFRFDRLRMKIDGQIVAQTGTSGTLLMSNQPVLVGVGFAGNLDELSLRSETGSLATASGLDVGSSLQLDANGQGSFTITSTGNAVAGDALHFSAATAPASGSGQGSSAQQSSNSGISLPTAEAIVDFADAVHWDTTYDTVMAFVGGDPQTTQGTVSSIAGGLCVVGDVGSTVKNLWRMTAWSEVDPNYVELTLGGLGVLTTAAEVTGIGAPIDAAVASLKTLAIRFAGNAEALRFLNVFIEQIKYAIVTGGESFSWAKAKFLGKMVLDVPISTAFKNFLHDDALVNAAVRATEKLGDEAAEAFYQAGKIAYDTYGAETAKRFVKIFELLGEEAFTALKNAPAGELADALEGLAKVANKGIEPFTLSRVLNNKHIYGSAYKRTNLMKDMGELADVKGMDLLVDALRSANNKGTRYELEGAAWLKRSGKTIFELTKRVSVPWEKGTLGAASGKTDIDVIVMEGTTQVYYQFKRSYKAFMMGHGTVAKALDDNRAWVAKAMKDLGDEATHAQIRYATDAAATIPGDIANWFNSLDPVIVVERIPHLD